MANQVITYSVSLLKPSDVFKLLESLIPMIQSRGAVAACALPWIKSLLLQHANIIMYQKVSLIALNSLYQMKCSQTYETVAMKKVTNWCFGIATSWAGPCRGVLIIPKDKYFATVVTMWDAEFYIKVDDDGHVNIVVRHRKKKMVYSGCMKSVKNYSSIGAMHDLAFKLEYVHPYLDGVTPESRGFGGSAPGSRVQGAEPLAGV
ncbi:hypothetical protein Tco_0371558 [Tanacetum coccineum]